MVDAGCAQWREYLARRKAKYCFPVSRMASGRLPWEPRTEGGPSPFLCMAHRLGLLALLADGVVGNEKGKIGLRAGAG